MSSASSIPQSSFSGRNDAVRAIREVGATMTTYAEAAHCSIPIPRPYRLLVPDDAEVVGIITPADVARWLDRRRALMQ